MADPLYELLAPYFDETATATSQSARPSVADARTTKYFNRLSTLSLSELTTTEPASLLQAVQSHVRNLQALSKRSHKAVITSASHLSNLSSLLPSLETQSSTLQNDLPELENAATAFARKYDRSTENAVLDRRKRAMLLARNVDRVTDVLDLPSLLSSTVSAAQSTSTTSTSSAATSYAAALDLHAHIKRLNALYPHSGVVADISKQAEVEIQNLTTILITSLQSPSLKLAGAMRAIGWLRRVAPDLADDGYESTRSQPTSTKSFNVTSTSASADGSLGALFLVCRLRTLHDTLSALDPLRELADQETAARKTGSKATSAKQQPSTSTVGGQSERYLKRYIEIFREQSFSIISMYKSIFPSGLPTPDASAAVPSSTESNNSALSLPSPLSSFALHLVDMLSGTLREYVPNITDKQARESLLTQVLYCAGSLGRLGADFGMMIAILEEDLKAESVDESEGQEVQADQDPEWVQVMKKHRIQASRLEVLARGVGTGKKKGTGGESPTVMSPG